MAAPTDYFVDPAAGTDDTAGGRGASAGDPWASVQFALDNITRNATNGDKINVKSGSPDLIAASFDLSTYGVPALSVPLVLRGYETAADDGDFFAGTGIGEIDMQGNNSTILAAGGGIHYIHLHCHGTGSADVLSLTQDQSVIECEVSEATGGGIVSSSTGRSAVVGNHIHDILGVGIVKGRYVAFNYLKNDGASDFATAILQNSNISGSMVMGNIISIDGASDGIDMTSALNASAIGNSIFSNGGSGIGLSVAFGSNLHGSLISNLVEGFSNSGTGIKITAGVRENAVYANQAAYNSTTNYDDAGKVEFLLVRGNETLSGSPFAKSGADTFANRFTYFAPTLNAANGGTVRGGAYPSGSRRDKGAVQHADPAGGPPLIQTRRSTLIGR